MEDQKNHAPSRARIPPKENHTIEMVVGAAIPLVWNDYGVGALIEREEWRAGGRLTAKSVFSDLLAERNQLWLVLENRAIIKAAVLTDLRPYPNGLKTCMVLAVVGEEPRSWIGLASVLEDWARRNGCALIEAWGRLGWRRLLDWPMTDVLYEKRLTDEK